MKNNIKITVVNELLKELGYNNIQMINTPFFHWDGESVTDDETVPSQRIASYYLKRGLKAFLDDNKDNKIVIAPTPDDKLIDDRDNTIRAYIDNNKNQKDDTLKGKLIKMVLRDYIENDQIISLRDLQSNLQAHLNENLIFDVNVKNIDIVNSYIVGSVYFMEGDDHHSIDFTITGSNNKKDVIWKK